MLGLLIHAIEAPSRTRATTLRHTRALARYCDDLHVFPHYAMDPATDYLKRIKFDVVLLDATFLCLRWSRPRSAFEEIKNAYAWLSEVDACKLAFPQDDYDHGGVLDDWLADYNVDVVYSVLPEHRELIYSRCSLSARLKFALCGYIDDDDVAQYEVARKPFNQRTIDVGYRVRDLPAQFGRFGRIKSQLGTAFSRAAVGRNLALDIVVGDAGTLVGDDWPRFLGDCRYSLGSEGGSSVLDLYGEVKDRIDRLRVEHPGASEGELIEAGLRPEDEKIVFAMPTPRIFEMAMAQSCPVLVEGEYLGLLKPGEHYIPIARDFSNFDQVLQSIKDRSAGEKIARAASETLLGAPHLRYRNWAGEVRGDIEEASRGANIGHMSLGSAHDLFALHQDACREARAQASRATTVAMQGEIDRLASATTEAADLIERMQGEVDRLASATTEAADLIERLRAGVTEAAGQRDDAYREIDRIRANALVLTQERDDARQHTARLSTDLEYSLGVLSEMRRQIETPRGVGGVLVASAWRLLLRLRAWLRRKDELRVRS